MLLGILFKFAFFFFFFWKTCNWDYAEFHQDDIEPLALFFVFVFIFSLLNWTDSLIHSNCHFPAQYIEQIRNLSYLNIFSLHPNLQNLSVLKVFLRHSLTFHNPREYFRYCTSDLYSCPELLCYMCLVLIASTRNCLRIKVPIFP